MIHKIFKYQDQLAAHLWVTTELAAMGWTNVVYEFHSYEHVLNSVYTGERAYFNWEFDTQKQVADDNVPDQGARPNNLLIQYCPKTGLAVDHPQL